MHLYVVRLVAGAEEIHDDVDDDNDDDTAGEIRVITIIINIVGIPRILQYREFTGSESGAVEMCFD